MPIARELGRTGTKNEEIPSIKSHDSYITESREVTWIN